MKKKKKTTAKRILRAVCLVVVALLLYNIIGGYMPFVRCPVVEDTSAIEARAEEMQSDVETPDRVMVLATRQDALDERIRLLSRAQKEIVITSYDCRDGESTRDLLCVALERADAGVQVRLLVDGIAGVMSVAQIPLFRAIAAYPNIEIRLYNVPLFFMPWRHMGRMHDKYVIVDDMAYILGGRNMFDAFIGTYFVERPKDDREVLVYNGAHDGGDSAASSIHTLRSYFDGVWAMDTTTVFTGRPLNKARVDDIYGELRQRYANLRADKPELFRTPDYAEMTLPTKGVWLVSNPTNIYAKQPVVFEQLCALMRRSDNEVVIHTPYVALNDAMGQSLTEIASDTPVTLMVNAIEQSHNYGGSADYVYHRNQVISTGVDLLEYAGDNYYHGKAVLIDDALTIVGCYNLDLRSTYVDMELMLVVRGEEVNAQVRQAMEAMHGQCRIVTGPNAEEVPEGLEIEPLPIWKRALLRVIGAALQPVRNLV